MKDTYQADVSAGEFMSDTEALDLVENYGWALRREPEGWCVFTANFVTAAEDTVRSALRTALEMQLRWATGNSRFERTHP